MAYQNPYAQQPIVPPKPTAPIAPKIPSPMKKPEVSLFRQGNQVPVKKMRYTMEHDVGIRKRAAQIERKRNPWDPKVSARIKDIEGRIEKTDLNRDNQLRQEEVRSSADALRNPGRKKRLERVKRAINIRKGGITRQEVFDEDKERATEDLTDELLGL